MALVLETLGSDESLDLGGLGVGLLALTLGLDLAADDELANLKAKQSATVRWLVTSKIKNVHHRPW